MRNLQMEMKLQKGAAIDLSGCDRTPEGDYILTSEQAAMAGGDRGYDFCDAKQEAWIWSIGREFAFNTATGEMEPTGRTLASTTAKFYGNARFECIWLR